MPATVAAVYGASGGHHMAEIGRNGNGRTAGTNPVPGGSVAGGAGVNSWELVMAVAEGAVGEPRVIR